MFFRGLTSLRGASLARWPSSGMTMTSEMSLSSSSSFSSSSSSSSSSTPSFPLRTAGWKRMMPFGMVMMSMLAYGGLSAFAEEEEEEVKTGLDPQEWRGFKLLSKEKLTHDTAAYRFALPSAEHELGLPVAGCLIVKSDLPADQPNSPTPFLTRPYTPTSTEHQKGHFDLVVKTYPEGKVSKYFERLVPGESVVEMKGPIKKLDITANQFQKITFVVGGTGITPAYQILRKLLDDPSDRTRLHLIYSVHTEQDVILQPELNQYLKAHPDRFSLQLIVTRPQSAATPRQYITQDLLAAHLPPPSLASQKIFVCGPPAFYRSISGTKAPDFTQGELSGYLKDLGYSADQVFKL